MSTGVVIDRLHPSSCPSAVTLTVTEGRLCPPHWGNLGHVLYTQGRLNRAVSWKYHSLQREWLLGGNRTVCQIRQTFIKYLSHALECFNLKEEKYLLNELIKVWVGVGVLPSRGGGVRRREAILLP